MREIFTYGSVGGAPGDRCFYLEPDGKGRKRGQIYLIPSREQSWIDPDLIPHKLTSLREIAKLLLCEASNIEKPCTGKPQTENCEGAAGYPAALS